MGKKTLHFYAKKLFILTYVTNSIALLSCIFYNFQDNIEARSCSKC